MCMCRNRLADSMRNKKNKRSQNIFEEEQVGRLALSAFKTYDKATIIKTG